MGKAGPCEREKPSAVSQWTRIDKNEGKITSSAGGCLLCARAIVANFHRLRYTDSEKFFTRVETLNVLKRKLYRSLTKLATIVHAYNQLPPYVLVIFPSILSILVH